ncbi:MAG TPA: NrfD/PsrC family molybdoenzyme membrane anchor subunit [Tepidisphaeraceae bacterium]|nr:NrfD/PsrC family molybdoenzyme membrane anchor subunit [Tepidisphaeraceae bacterium]
MAEDLKDFRADAGWTENLRHHSDPNRIGSRTVLSSERFNPGPPIQATDGRPPHKGSATQYARSAPPVRRPLTDPQSISAPPSYYDVPMLKQPVWKWQIATYFYLGGLSAGACVLSRAAERAGGSKFRDLTRVGAYIALATILPCPPLLIWDLGDPKRFHHMLRVWKPGSPMNFGTWTIVAYSGMATFEAVRQYLNQNARRLTHQQRTNLLKVMNNGTVMAFHDAAGIPFALIVAGYTGVLLSCTSNPLWCKNPWIGPLFSASAISTGAEALSLALDLTTREVGNESSSHSVLRTVDSVAHAAEITFMEGFMRYAGQKAAALKHGRMSVHRRLSTGAILLSEVLKHLPVRRDLRKPIRMLASLFGLTGGYLLRWAMVFGGHESASDPDTCRLVSAPGNSAKAIDSTAPAATGRLADASRVPLAVSSLRRQG